jgi:polysaccharide biosynthesis/export protein
MLKNHFILLIFFVLIISNNLAIAQNVDELSDQEIINFMKQAKESGLTEEQLMAAAAAKGYTASDLVKFKDKVGKIQANKKPTIDKESNKTRETDSTDIENEEKNKYDKKIDSIEEQKRLRIFGLNIFNNKTINFQPNLKIATPKNYVLGTDDELSIDISGYAYAHYTSKVSAEGTVKIENLSPIYVSGQTIEQAKEKIIQRLKTLFGGIGSNGNLTADVTLTKTRSIKITVIGEAVFPGTYTVPSLATVFNLLYQAGGPTDIGSLRNIEVFRSGKQIRTLDLYDFLLNGDLKDNILLHDQDVIRIPYVDIHVILNGQVRNPKIYELKRGETLKTLLAFAGGFNEVAYSKTIRLDRITPTEKKIITVDKEEIPYFLPQKGDIFQIDSVLNRFENQVIISGGIFRKGSYELEPGMTLKSLIAKAEGLRPDAFKERIIIHREKENQDIEILAIDYTKILSGEIADIILKRQDSVQIKTHDELRQKRTVQIDGEVNNPNIFDFADNLTVGDLIAMAKGFKDGASASKIEIARRVKEESNSLTKDQTIQIIQISIDKDLKINEVDSKMILKPFDRIYVRKLARYEEQKNVTITGEILYPGPYSLQDKTERISDLIIKSGGTKDQADISGAKFTRAGKQIGIDLKRIIDDPKNINNLLLNTGDALDIPRRKETVTISGNVYNPITVPYEPNLKLKDYLSLAGGTTDSAFVRKTYVKYGNGRLKTTKRFLGLKTFPKVENGSEIFVPTERKQKWTPAERIAVSSAVVSIATVLISIILRVIPNQ